MDDSHQSSDRWKSWTQHHILETLKKMGLDFVGLITPIGIPFYGIVPGKAVMPLGQITLPITFGTQANYQTEFIQFEVADFEASYHAILGRLALAKFMAIPHYPYPCSRC
jgi:hypothetical protein